jgi:hypothetical protein
MKQGPSCCHWQGQGQVHQRDCHCHWVVMYWHYDWNLSLSCCFHRIKAVLYMSTAIPPAQGLLHQVIYGQGLAEDHQPMSQRLNCSPLARTGASTPKRLPLPLGDIYWHRDCNLSLSQYYHGINTAL